MNILLIEDEKLTRISLGNLLRKQGNDVELCETGIQGLHQLNKKKWNIVITDLRLPKTSGMDILRKVREIQPHCAVIVITAFATVETAIESLKLGAYDYLTKPFEPDQLLQIINHIRQFQEVSNENKLLKNKIKKMSTHKVIGNSIVMTKLLQTAKTIALNDYTILIQGESGTGKEVLARFLHENSSRKKNSFITINCAVIPETLLESELFGHEKGSFSGAIKQHIGYFERGNGGTIFIDDIDDLPYSLQVKLLRVLQERELVRIGGSKTIKVDVRIICATKVNLLEKVKKQEFRDDLYYRLNIIPLNLPPLRERKEDIPGLIRYFLEKRGLSHNTLILNTHHLQVLQNYDWPGNVRELENIVERLLALSQVGTLNETVFDSLNNQSYNLKKETIDYPPLVEYLTNCEEKIINWALSKANNNISKAADLLQIPRSTLRSKMEKLQL